VTGTARKKLGTNSRRESDDHWSGSQSCHIRLMHRWRRKSNLESWSRARARVPRVSSLIYSRVKYWTFACITNGKVYWIAYCLHRQSSADVV
jgi:hypothetical protein